MAVLVAAVLMRERRRPLRSAHPAARWARRVATWCLVYFTVSVAGHGADYLVYARPLERAQPAVAEAAALAGAGRAAEARARITDGVMADLEWSAAVAPRSAQRRADLALVRGLTGDPRAPTDLARARNLARSGDIAPVLAAVDIDVDTALTRAGEALKGPRP